MSYWEPLNVDGAAYSLEHLEPFEFQIIPTGFENPVTISVRFHDHCFTEKFDPQRHSARLITNQASLHEERAFCPIRYACSLELPDIIRNFDRQKISSNREGNLIKLELANGRIYPVFFTLRRERENRLNMFVVSAYILEECLTPATTGSMKFNLVVTKILRRLPLKFPPR